MIDNDNMRNKFCSRLHEALDNISVRRRGRGADIIKVFKNEGAKITPQAVNKWLTGVSIPDHYNINILANWLGVSQEWLRYGEGMAALSSSVVVNNRNSSGAGSVVILNFRQAEAVLRGAELYSAESVFCPVPISRSGYALVVLGDSMTGNGSGKSYPAGGIIFVDPEVIPRVGDSVVARFDGLNEFVLKILVCDVGRFFLKSINQHYPIYEVTEEVQICGKVVGLFVPE